MAAQLLEYRQRQHLPPLQCITLTEVVGEYWRFHNEGHAAVSTIEAIGHTALAAGMKKASYDDLLTLFNVQKYRVLEKTRQGGKCPRAVQVEGDGLGNWKAMTDALDDV